MSQWIKLVNRVKSKQGILALLLTAVFLVLGYAWHKDSIVLLLVVVLLFALLAAGLYYSWFVYRHGKPEWFTRIPGLARAFATKVKHVNWQRDFQRKADSSNIPWFLVIGPTGSGKTALLKASEFHFNIIHEMKDESYHYYDKWFSNDAVMIDTPGSLLEESDWAGFARHLKKTKRHSVLKGIILTLSATALIQGNEQSLPVDRISKRIDALYRHLGIRLPIYLIITQCDNLTGFNTCFNHLDDKGRQQVCGVELTDNHSVQSQLSHGLTNLYQRLGARLFKQLHLQPTQADKADFIQLPHAFKQAQLTLETWVNQLVRESIYQEKIRLSGVYFSSARTKKDDNTGYFIHGLLNDKLFNTTLAFQVSSHRKKLQDWYKKTGVFLLFLSMLGGLWGVFSAYIQSSDLLKQGKILAQSGIDEIENQSDELPAHIDVDAIGQHVYHLRHFKETHSWFQRMGVGRVKSQLERYETILANALKQTLYKPLMHYMSNELKKTHQQWLVANDTERRAMRGDYYTKIKLYLMLNFPQHIELDFASNALAQNWQQMQRLRDKTIEAPFSDLLALSRTYLEYLRKMDKNERRKMASYNASMIHAARQDLLTSSGISNIYAMLEHQLSSHLGAITPGLFLDNIDFDLWDSRYHLSRFYSKEGYKMAVSKAFMQHAKYSAKKDWVIHAHLNQLANHSHDDLQRLNDKRQREHLVHAFNAMYFQNYLTKWVEFIASLKAAPFDSYEVASQRLSAFYQANGAFQQLFSALNENFSLRNIVSSDDYNALPAAIRRSMNQLKKITRGGVDTTAFFDPYLKQLAMVQQDIERLSIDSDLSHTAQKYAAGLLAGEGHETALYKISVLVETLGNQMAGLASKQAVKTLLLSPVQEAYRTVVQQAANGLQHAWTQDVLKMYHERLSRYFPFNHQGKDASLDDFIVFFNPKKGVFSQFQQKIKPFISQDGKRYVPKKWLGVAFPCRASFLKSLYQVSQLSLAIFPHDKDDLLLRYTLFPFPTAGVKEILFSSNGQSYPYRNGPQEWVTFSWPGQDAMDNETVIRVTQALAEIQSVKSFQGVWGLFHLLVAAQHREKIERGYRLQWVFQKGSDKKVVQLLLRAKTQVDIFDRLVFNPLHLEKKLSI